MRCATCLYLVLLSACGFTGEPPFGNRPLPDVAPWLDRGPVTFCDGALRIGAPASQPAGFCAPAGALPRPCTGDGDCASRERCTCGGCQIPLCTSGDECPA